MNNRIHLKRKITLLKKGTRRKHKKMPIFIITLIFLITVVLGFIGNEVITPEKYRHKDKDEL